MTSTTAKPCPFCGRLPYEWISLVPGHQHQMTCINRRCKVKPGLRRGYLTRAHARRAWNRRYA